MGLSLQSEAVQNGGVPDAAHDAANEVEAQEIPPSPSSTETRTPTAHSIIKQYLLERAPEFQRLTALRRQGWNNPQGDKFFAKQRRVADNANQDEKTALHFYEMMKNIAKELHTSTGALQITIGTTTKAKARARRSSAASAAHPPRILDMCAAPGGFLDVALALNRRAHAVAFSLPVADGGHRMLLPRNPDVALEFMDVTMLAADMGVSASEIPADHPDAGNFLPSHAQFNKGQIFDLVLCDGQVLRTHAPHRAEYRERREASRLALTQLALGLEHLRPGGTMVVLLHKVEAWDTLCLLDSFSSFSGRVRTFKPLAGHAKRSSFYMVATDVRSRDPGALKAVSDWKETWRLATFGNDEEYAGRFYECSAHVEEVLERFGPKFIQLGRRMWEIQANALEKAPFIKGANARRRSGSTHGSV